MGKRLQDNLSSLYIGAANRLRPKRARQKIVAYVESYDDVLFWRMVLADYENDTRYFQIMLPSQNSLSKGKKSVLMNRLGPQLGANMIACVDSDYDYLIQGATNTSRQMMESPYVLETYVYAIENYECYAEGLHEVCVMATLNDRPMMDFVEFMKLYSRISYPLFLWSVWLYKHHILNTFSMMDFCGVVRLDSVNVRHPEGALEALQDRVSKKLNWIQRKFKNRQPQVDEFGKELRALGVYPENTYLFIQGHHIFDNVVMKLLEPVCKQLRRERESEIHQLAEHNQQLYNELTNYQHSQSSVDAMLKKSLKFKGAPQYQKVRDDLEGILRRLK